MSDIQADREKARPRVDEILTPYLKQINATPEMLSLLYDIDMLPEQTTSIIGAIRLAAFCEIWKRIEDAELALRVWDKGGESEYWLRHPRARS